MADEVMQRDNNGKMPGGITGKGFVKGDKRINRKGRPKSFDALRALAQQIATERAAGRDVTNIEKVLRDFIASKNPIDKYKFIEIAYGKVPDELKQTGEMKVVIEYAKDNPADPASQAEADQSGTQEI